MKTMTEYGYTLNTEHSPREVSIYYFWSNVSRSTINARSAYSLKPSKLTFMVSNSQILKSHDEYYGDDIWVQWQVLWIYYDNLEQILLTNSCSAVHNRCWGSNDNRKINQLNFLQWFTCGQFIMSSRPSLNILLKKNVKIVLSSANSIVIPQEIFPT